ncbi:uncharacterized protein LOC134689673 [Mytilus trossulus]|uniref:uncharacterized protein LOC134689673 n=1 Tax=Mytilus trossulus TaxID=6551 RepID=UPI0030078594
MNKSLALLVRGLCAGLSTQPRKETYATETETRENQLVRCRQIETYAGMQPMTSDKTLRNSILSPKQTLKFGCWNVRTMNETSRTDQTIKEMKRFKLDILGVSECRWTDSGKYKHNSGTEIYYSGRTDGRHQEGVAILLSKSASNSVAEWIAINERITKIRMKTSYGHMTVIQCYAPTNDYTDNEKEIYYDKLNQIIMDTPKHDVPTIIGDFNAKVGSTNIGSEEVMGKHVLGEINNNGERLVEMSTGEQQERSKDLYNSKEKEVKKNAKADKKAYIDKIAKEAKNASKVGDMRKLYNITKQLSGRVNTNSTHIKDKDGQTICKFEKQLERWKEHFEEVLNRPEPKISVDRSEEAPPPIEIEMGPITDDEIKAAIKKLKNNKAPMVDGIPAEVLKSDINLNVNILRDLLHEIWEKEILPTQWKDGTLCIIIKLPKKSNLTDCNNWRGITISAW